MKFIISSLTFSLLLPLSAHSITEIEEQQMRIPKPLTQKESHGLLMQLNNKVQGELAPAGSLSSYLVGKKFSKGNESKANVAEDVIVRNQCMADESQFLLVQSSLIKSWAETWAARDAKQFSKLLTKDAKFNSFNNKSYFKKIDTLEHADWDRTETILGSKLISKDISSYLNSFTKIEDIDLVTKYLQVPMMTRANDLSMKFMKAEVRFDLRGHMGNVRRTDRGYLSVSLVKEGESDLGGWKISGIDILKMETLQTAKPSFREITSESGLGDVTSYNRIEAIRRGGYALATGDFDGDGIVDVYVGSYGPAQLFKGLKGGGYQEVKDTGLEPHLYVKSAVFADFNNDGNEDLLVVRFVPRKNEPANGFRNTDLILYKNLGGGKFQQTAKVVENSPTDYAMPAAVADFNGDGLLDFYIGYPGNKDFSTFGVSFDFKKELKAQGVYMNKGNFEFVPQRMGKVAYEEYSEAQQVFPHSSAAIDFNQDGHVDIVVIDDRGNLSPLYENTGKGEFTQTNQKWSIENYDYGMGIGSADVNNDGLTDMFITNVRFNAKNRFIQHCRQNWDTDLYKIRDNKRDIKAFIGKKVNGSKKFIESAEMLGLEELGDGLAGMEFLDYNNDGYTDIYVANGLWSGTSKFDDISSQYARAEIGNERVFMEVRDTTQSQYMNILSHYKGGMFGDRSSNDRLSLGGFQRNRLFRNNGDGTFMEVGFLEGVDSIADGYVMARVDMDNDGKLDLILRNGDPGTSDVKFAPVQVFKNSHDNANSLRIKLVGSDSNKDAIGAEVIVDVENMLPQTLQSIANLGTAQSEKILHFGLGEAKQVRSVTVKWPKGKISIFKDLKPGFITIKESGELESNSRMLSSVQK